MKVVCVVHSTAHKGGVVEWVRHGDEADGYASGDRVPRSRRVAEQQQQHLLRKTMEDTEADSTMYNLNRLPLNAPLAPCVPQDGKKEIKDVPHTLELRSFLSHDSRVHDTFNRLVSMTTTRCDDEMCETTTTTTNKETNSLTDKIRGMKQTSLETPL